MGLREEKSNCFFAPMSFDEFHQRTTPQDSNLFVKSGDGQDAVNALAKKVELCLGSPMGLCEEKSNCFSPR